MYRLVGRLLGLSFLSFKIYKLKENIGVFMNKIRIYSLLKAMGRSLFVILAIALVVATVAVIQHYFGDVVVVCILALVLFVGFTCEALS